MSDSIIDLSKLDYPYYRETVNPLEIRRTFAQWKSYKLKAQKKGRFFHITINYDREKEFMLLTDYFSEQIRVKCHFDKNPSPYEWYQAHKKEIMAQLGEKASYQQVDYKIWKNTKSCSKFPNVIALFLLKWLKVKRWLDPSSGWGDRLLAALNYGCEYQGYDPNTAMHASYQKMINFFAANKKEKYSVATTPFERARPKREYYDLVFTSPPFFTLEIYSKEETQCNISHPSLELWLENFMFPLIDTAYQSLVKDGHLALYISDYKGTKYVKRCQDYIAEHTEFKYRGAMTWNQSKSVRSIYIWKK